MKHRTVIGLGLLAAAIGSGVFLLAPSIVTLFQWGGFSPRAQRWLDATVRGDSLGLVSQAVDPALASRTLTLSRRRPDLLQAAMRSLRLRAGSRVGDTVLVRFAIDHSECGVGGREDELLLSFLDTELETKVLWMGMDLCR
jgi:hypothetical protein